MAVLWVLCKRFSLHTKVFSLVRETIGFFRYKSLYFECRVRNNADARRCSYFELGLPVGSFDLYDYQVGINDERTASVLILR